MIVAIHQPNFAPWLGWFAKAAACDVFILLDDVPFSKGSYTNRVQLNGARGAWWATVPVKTAGALGQLIRDVELVDDDSWRGRLLQRIAREYGDAAPIASLVDRGERRLAEYNIAIIRELFTLLHIAPEVRLASELRTEGQATEKLIALVKGVGGTKYLAGTGAKSYHDETRFAEEGIELCYRSIEPPAYRQKHEPRAGLSVLDALLNVGVEETRALIAAMR